MITVRKDERKIAHHCFNRKKNDVNNHIQSASYSLLFTRINNTIDLPPRTITAHQSTITAHRPPYTSCAVSGHRSPLMRLRSSTDHRSMLSSIFGVLISISDPSPVCIESSGCLGYKGHRRCWSGSWEGGEHPDRGCCIDLGRVQADGWEGDSLAGRMRAAQAGWLRLGGVGHRTLRHKGRQTFCARRLGLRRLVEEVGRG